LGKLSLLNNSKVKNLENPPEMRLTHKL
jgi:hypothetical protein